MAPVNGDDDDLLNLSIDIPVEALRRRLHRLADTVQAHEGKLGEHGVLIQVMTSNVEALRKTTASREQLDHAIERVTAQLSTAHEENKLRLDHLNDRFDPVLKGLTWVVGLICTGVVLAILQLVLKK